MFQTGNTTEMGRAVIAISRMSAYFMMASISIFSLVIAFMKDANLALAKAFLEQQHMVNKDINVDEKLGYITEHYAAFQLYAFVFMAMLSIVPTMHFATMHFADQPDKNRARFCIRAVLTGLALLASVGTCFFCEGSWVRCFFGQADQPDENFAHFSSNAVAVITGSSFALLVCVAESFGIFGQNLN